MTPRERAEEFGNKLFDYCRFGLSDKYRISLIAWINGELSEAILADRQALQSELEKRFTDPLDEYPTKENRKWAIINITRVIEIIQSVFAQQSHPEAGKPHAFQGRSDRWCEICNQPDRAEIHKVLVDVAFQQSVIETECNRRILADRQALQSEIAERLNNAHRNWLHNGIVAGQTQCGFLYNFHREIQSVFAQQSQPEEKLKKETCMAQFFDPDCSTCVREAKEEAEENAKKNSEWEWSDFGSPAKHRVVVPPKRIETVDQLTRIATLHEWQAQDQKTIQSLNASNNALSEKIAQLEKEKNELTQKLEQFQRYHAHLCDGPGYCILTACPNSSPASRKA